MHHQSMNDDDIEMKKRFTIYVNNQFVDEYKINFPSYMGIKCLIWIWF